MKKLPLVIPALIFFAISCNKTQEPAPDTSEPCQPTYNKEIKSITDSKCAISGCHDGSGSLVSLAEYSELKTRADNGRLQSHVVEKKIMPPASADALTDTELETFKCWLENGAPES